jgi:chemotaxis protein CheZ
MDEEQKSADQSLCDSMQAHAAAFHDAVERGDMQEASSILQHINSERDSILYKEVGKLTRELHNAIVNFNIDTNHAVLSEQQKSEMADAQDNLGYVIKLTQQSADKTMDMVEEGIPMVTALADEASELKAVWAKLTRRELSKQEFGALAERIGKFLDKSAADSLVINEKLSTILLAQDFQDLTGQVLQRVMGLVQEVESSLVHLMKIAGQVDQITGQQHKDKVKKQAKDSKDIVAEGPIINAEERENVVSSQDEVDDLLSSLGF